MKKIIMILSGALLTALLFSCAQMNVDNNENYSTPSKRTISSDQSQIKNSVKKYLCGNFIILIGQKTVDVTLGYLTMEYGGSPDSDRPHASVSSIDNISGFAQTGNQGNYKIDTYTIKRVNDLIGTLQIKFNTITKQIEQSFFTPGTYWKNQYRPSQCIAKAIE